MLCLKMEMNSEKECLGEKYLTDAKARRRSPEEVVLFYGDNCVLICATNDYRRTIPSFQQLSGGLEFAHIAVQEDESIEEGYLKDVTPRPNDRVLTFDNGATFVVSNALYAKLENEFAGDGDWAYSFVCKFLLDNCD